MRAPARSQFVGAAAAVTVAAAVVAAPVGLQPTAPRLSLPVSPAGFDSPLSELLLSVRVVNNDLFNGRDVFGDYPWLPFQGLVPQFIYTALPIISQVGYNGVGYIGGSVEALTDAGLILSDALSNLPSAVVTATRQLISGHVADAIATLNEAIVVPIRDAGTIALDAGTAVLGAVAGNIGRVVSAVPGILRGLATTTFGSGRAVLSAAATVVRNAAAALAASDFAGAWNAVVDGLLGPVGSDGLVSSSVPGTLTAATIGPGLGPQGYPSGYAVPSFRMWAERSQLTIADAVGADYPVASTAARRGTEQRARHARPAAAAGDRSASTPAAPGRIQAIPSSTRHTIRGKRSGSGPRPAASVRNRP